MKRISKISLNRPGRVEMKVYFLIMLFLMNNSLLFAQPIPVIDVSKDYPEKRIVLQDIADIDYVLLETNDDVLLDRDYKIVHISDNYIVVSNPRQGDVFIFGRNGKIKYAFNHRGQGSMEYLNAMTLVFDEQNKEVFITNRRATGLEFLVYSEEGKYKRTLKCPSDVSSIGAAYTFDDEHILVYDYLVNVGNFEKQPYRLVSKNDGTITPLNITLPQRYSTIMEVEGTRDEEGLSWYTFFQIESNWIDGQDFIISDISCDTLFRLKPDKSITPLVRQTPSVHRTDPKIYLSSLLQTEKYMLLRRDKMTPDSKDYITTLLYDFSNGEIVEVGSSRYPFLNGDWKAQFHSIKPEAATPKNTLVFTIQAHLLHEYSEYTTGVLAQIASTIDEEDNPVVMIAKFR